MDMFAGVMVSVGSAADSLYASVPEMPALGLDFAAYTPDFAVYYAYVVALVEATYLSGAGIFLDGGFFLEYGYALAAIASAVVFVAVMWFSFRAQIVSMVDMKMPAGVTYTASELARKLSLGGMSAVSEKDEKPSMKMKSSPAPSMKAESEKKTPMSMKKSPAKTMKKSPARGKTPTPSKKSPAKSMKK